MAQSRRVRRAANAGPKSWRRTVKSIKTSRRKGGMQDWNFPSRMKAVWKARTRRKRVNRGFRHKLKRAMKRGELSSAHIRHVALRHMHRTQRREETPRSKRKNVGEILTVIPANPGRRRNTMAATIGRRRRAAGRLTNRRPRARANPRANPRVTVRYHNRRHNPNGLALTGNTAAVVGILGGATVTKIITGFLPSNLTSGFTGMLTTGVVAMVTGNVTGRMTKNRSLGNWMTVGGLLIVGLQLAGQLFPQLQLPFGLSTPTSGTSGLGLISSSNFYVPQVNLPGSMASFVTPAGIPAPVVVPAPAGMHGLGNAMNQGLRRMGRLR